MRRLTAVPGLALLCAVLIAACHGSDGTVAPISVSLPADAQITVHGGDGQIGPALSLLPVELAVRVTASGGRPVEGARILWAVDPAGGITTVNTSITNAAGVASVARRLGANAGRFTTTATIEQTTKSVRLSSVAQIDGATRMDLPPGTPVAYAPDTVLAPVATPYRVRLLDQDGLPVPGVAVTWTALGGTVSSGASVSDENGIAEVTHTRGPLAGMQQVRASVTGLGGSPVAFSTTATPGRPVVMTSLGGEDQMRAIGRTLHEPFVVTLSDAYGNSVAGVAIEWFAESDGGAALLAATTTVPAAPGEALAFASYRHRAERDEGTHRVLAVANGLDDVAPVSFTYTALPSSPAVVFVGDWDAEGWCFWYLGYCGFNEPHVEVLTGETVRWVWEAGEAHDIIFEDDPSGPASASARITGTHERTFSTPGTYRYRCTLHSNSYASGMVGSVTVLE